jgi:molecular chaperone DnaK
MDFGIDFGTTNSACVGIEDGRREIKFTDGYDNPFPSLVIIDRATGRVYCGREAWRRREELRESCEVITSVKTLLDSGTIWNIAGRTWTPEMVAAQVFLALKDRVRKRIGEDLLKEAVVAVPVGFPAGKRVALREAARLAGIEIKSFISEPTAALFCHYGEVGHYTRIGVFDWGGGTLDVSVIENRNGRVKELATAGLNVAGDYIDRLMAEWMHGRIIKKMGLQVSFNEMPPEARDKMLAACEQAKRDLTWDERAEIQFVNYGEIEYVHESINFDDFSGLITPVVDQAVHCFENCIRQAGMSITQLDCILMVGGSVNLRPLSERIAKSWNGKEVYPPDSDWSVARGAARLSVCPGKHLLAQTVGIIMSDGSLYPLLKEGQPVALEECTSATFALVEDEPAANLVFSDGEERVLGYLNVPAFGFFREKIEVSAQIDRDLILRVKARSLNRTARTTREWHYNALRVDYQLPVTRIEVTDDE